MYLGSVMWKKSSIKLDWLLRNWKNPLKTFFLFRVVSLILEQPATAETTSAAQNTRFFCIYLALKY